MRTVSEGRTAGIALLADMQAEAYANHEGWRYQLDRERDERGRQLNAWRMSEIGALDLVTHPAPGSDVAAAAKKMLDDANEAPPAVDIPTPFQNPNDYRILDNLRRRIAVTAERTKVEVPAGVTLGTLPMGDVEARTWPVKGTDQYVVVVREGVLSFVHVLGKVLLSAMEVEESDGTARFNADLDRVAANIATKPQIAQDFDTLLDACFTHGNAWYAPHRYPPPSYMEPLGKLIDSGELFVVCHELAHIKLDHFKPDPARKNRAAELKMPEGIYCEFEADLVGMHDALAVMGANFGGWVREAASGIPLLLTGLDLYERARAHYPNAEPSRPDPTHPSYAERRTAIYATWSGYDMAEELLRGAATIDRVLEMIWSAFEKVRPALPASAAG
jgi:hypothetical protein